MHHSHRATDAGKATSASLTGASDSLSLNGSHPSFARANPGVTATTAVGCRLRSLRHRRLSHWHWSVAGKSSGSRVSSGAYRKKSAFSDHANDAKARVRTTVGAGKAAQEPEVLKAPVRVLVGHHWVSVDSWK